MNAVDTNIWLYAVDHRETEKRQRAFELLNRLAADDGCVTSWQVVSEFVNAIRRWERQGVVSKEKIDDLVSWMFELFPVIVPHHGTVFTALDLGRRYHLSHWDSMLLAACVEAGVTTLYSEDLGNGTKYDSVTVVNPFKLS